MPDKEDIVREVTSVYSKQRDKFVESLTGGSKHLEGLVSISNTQQNCERRRPLGPINQYAQQIASQRTDQHTKQNKATFVNVHNKRDLTPLYETRPDY